MKKLIFGFSCLLFATISKAQIPIITYSTPQTYIIGTAISPLIPTNTGGSVPTSSDGIVTTLAGSSYGNADGTGTAAKFRSPSDVAVDTSGNIYVADYTNNMIRKITPAGVVSTLAGSTTSGSTDGTGTAATFYHPNGIAVDASGNVYVAETSNNMIRKISPAGVVTTLAGSTTSGSADGTGIAASFHIPADVAVDTAGYVYVADYDNNMIRKISPEGVVTTFAGSTSAGSTNGIGTAARFYNPVSIDIDKSGCLYVADQGNNCIRKITPAGVVTTLAGSSGSYGAGSTNGTGTAASFDIPCGISVDALGNVYVGDYANHMIRKITSAGVVTTLAGSTTSGSANGTGTAASFCFPRGVAINKFGNVYVADWSNNLIRKITQTGYYISPALPAGLNFDVTTGTISGTPTVETAATTYTITATNASGSSIATISIATKAPATPVITWAAPSAITYGTPLSATQLNATADVEGTFAYTPAIGSILNAGDSDLTVTFTPTDGANYGVVKDTVQITVNKAILTITAKDTNRVYGTENPEFKVTYTGFVNGENESVLTTQPTVGTNATAASDAGIYDIIDSGALATNYNINYVNGSLTIEKATPVITWTSPSAITYGTPLSATQLNATADVEGAFAYNPASGTILDAGTNQVLATEFTPTVSKNYISIKDTVYITVTSLTAISESKNSTFGVYPNPLSDGFFVNGITGKASIILMDVTGKTFLQKNISPEEYIPVCNLPKGAYVLLVQTSEKSAKIKLVKK